jgi:hypothetical protein
MYYEGLNPLSIDYVTANSVHRSQLSFRQFTREQRVQMSSSVCGRSTHICLTRVLFFAILYGSLHSGMLEPFHQLQHTSRLSDFSCVLAREVPVFTSRASARRRRGSHIFYAIGSQMAVRLSTAIPVRGRGGP